MGEVSLNGDLQSLSGVINIPFITKELTNWATDFEIVPNQKAMDFLNDAIISPITASDVGMLLTTQYVHLRDTSLFNERCKSAYDTISNELKSMLQNLAVRVMPMSSYSASIHVYDPDKLIEQQVSDIDFGIVMDDRANLKEEVLRRLKNGGYSNVGDKYGYTIMQKGVMGVEVEAKVRFQSKSVNAIIVHDYLNNRMSKSDADIISLMKYYMSNDQVLYGGLKSVIYKAYLYKALTSAVFEEKH